MPERRHPPVTKEFAGYRIKGQIGVGGMSDVYAAEDLSGNIDVALKLITPEHTQAYEDRDRRNAKAWKEYKLLRGIRWEGEILITLVHPNIIRGYDFGKEQGRLYIVMEQLDPRDLKQLLHSSDPRITNRLVILAQIADGLTYIHEMGLIHRDISPKNVLVTPEGLAKIIDFSLAVPKLDRLKDVFYRAGTPSYMAPELIRTNLFNELTDVYAFGVTMYEVLTGTLPFRGSDRADRLQAHLNERPDPPRTKNPSIPRDIDQTIMDALEPDPDKRIQKMSVIRDRLFLAVNKIGAHFPGRSSSATKGGSKERRKHQRLAAQCFVRYAFKKLMGVRVGHGVTRTVDISETGIKLVLNAPPKQKSQMDLQIRLPGELDFIRAGGEVLRVAPRNDGRHDVALRMKPYTDADNERLLRFLKHAKNYF